MHGEQPVLAPFGGPGRVVLEGAVPQGTVGQPPRPPALRRVVRDVVDAVTEGAAQVRLQVEDQAHTGVAQDAGALCQAFSEASRELAESRVQAV